MASSKFITVVLSLLLCMSVLHMAQGHGRMRNPPSRASMWRDGFNNPANYDDNQLFCGGAQYQRDLGGKCGICGDPYDQPRLHEAGGPYANGIIVKQYTKNQAIDVTIEITAHHKGWFEFRICPNNNVNSPATQECLDSHILEEFGTGSTRYQLPADSAAGNFNLRYKLPYNMVCEQCVLQWRYHTGNSWGCGNEGCCLGCGPQEEFYACSDVAIIGTSGPNPTTTTTTQASTTPATSPSSTTTTTTSTTTTTAPSGGECTYIATGPWKGDKSVDDWCTANCVLGYCPATTCEIINC